MNVKEIENKLYTGEVLSSKEVKEYLRCLSYEIRKSRGLLNKDNKKDKKCNECFLDVNKQLQDKFTTYHSLFPHELGIELFHKAGIAGFNTEDGPRYYIIDLTHQQFDDDKYPLGNEEYVNFKKIIMADPEKQSLALELEQTGFVDLTISNIRSYMDIFIDGMSQNRKLNKAKIYDLLINNLKKNNIKFTNQNLVNIEKQQELSVIFNIPTSQLQNNNSISSHIK